MGIGRRVVISPTGIPTGIVDSMAISRAVAMDNPGHVEDRHYIYILALPGGIVRFHRNHKTKCRRRQKS